MCFQVDMQWMPCNMPTGNIPDLIQIHSTPLWQGTCEDCTRYYIDNAEQLLYYLWNEASSRRRPYTIDDGLIIFFDTRHRDICQKETISD